MKRIVILDTSINNTNLGNRIIVDSVCEELRAVFPHDFFYHVPALEYAQSGKVFLSQADHIFLAGTNLLRSDLNHRWSSWTLRLADARWMKNLTLLGLGWWQYQDKSPNLYTRFLLGRILKRDVYHSLRDAYTERRVKELGLKTVNTGCPTIWKLTELHCASIPVVKADDALITFTEYNQNPRRDRLLFDVVRKNYSKISVWPQMFGDYKYARDICGNAVKFLDPSTEALNDFLASGPVDYVGTRLHAGIRALQYKRRSVIVGIDNRACEMGSDFNLPVLHEDSLDGELERKIQTEWVTQIRLDLNGINAWKEQFRAA